MTLFDRLAVEAGKRDLADPPTSKVLAALTAQGLTLLDRRQQSAANAKAQYCLMVTADERVTLSICEFPDAASAALGAEASRAALRQIEGSSVEVNRSTTLAVIDSQATAASAAIKEKARAAFRSL